AGESRGCEVIWCLECRRVLFRAGQGADVGRGGGRGVDGVVAGVGAAEGQPGGGHRLGGAHVLVGEGGRAAHVADLVGAQHAGERSESVVEGEGGDSGGGGGGDGG